jgi:DNA invertase Pin-like site-specific DNA recombinase
MAGLAEFESALIGERVRAGMARARDEGKLISRPRIESGIAKRIKKLRKEGMTIRAISEEVGVSVGTVANYS